MQTQNNAVPQRYCVIPQSVQKRILNHPLCSNLFVAEIGYEDNKVFNQFPINKATMYYLLVYVVKGEGWYSVNNKKYKVKSNQYFILPKNTTHEYGSEVKNPWSIYWVHFSGELR